LYEPIKGNVLIASQNLFALDCLCAKVMGIEPYSVEHLRLADGEHLTTNLEIAGGSISSFSRKFKSQPPGLTSLEEEYSVKIKNGQACSSCLGALYLSLRKAKAQKPELLFGKEIVIGSYAGEVSSRTLFFGNCAVKKNRGNGTAIPGCVPSTSDFMEGLSQWGNYYQKLEKNI
jgi:hypothetical protein